MLGNSSQDNRQVLIVLLDSHSLRVKHVLTLLESLYHLLHQFQALAAHFRLQYWPSNQLDQRSCHAIDGHDLSLPLRHSLSRIHGR
jgi:hypothetical protein